MLRIRWSAVAYLSIILVLSMLLLGNLHNGRNDTGLAVITVPLVTLNQAPHINVSATTKTEDLLSRGQFPAKWPHSYHWYVPQPALLDIILRHMKEISPPVFSYKKQTDKPTNRSKIPKIIHQLWKDYKLPNRTKNWVSKWSYINPDWTYLFWTDQTAYKFIKTYYKPLVDVYDSLRIPVQKADLFRYVLLYAFGGVYADLDIEPLKSLNAIRDWSPCILSQEPIEHAKVSTALVFGNKPELNYTLACNAFMASRPGHPFMFYLVSRVASASEHVTHVSCTMDNTLGCTGPEMLTKAWWHYRTSLHSSVSDDDGEYGVYLAEPKHFLPTFDTEQVSRMYTACTRPSLLAPDARDACQQLKRRNFHNAPIGNQSFTNHHWFHSYRNQIHAGSHVKEIVPKFIEFFDHEEDFVIH